VTICNTFAQPIQIVSVILMTARGTLEKWGIEGNVTRWGQRVRGRKLFDGWEVLLGSDLQSQLIGPPSTLNQEANIDMARLEPLWPGEASELRTYFDATYYHGDRMEVTMTYIKLDATQRPICIAAEEAARTTFAVCERVADLPRVKGVDLYTPIEELGRDQRTVHAWATLKIAHPSFDIEQASARAGITPSSFGYDTKGRRWILVDPQRQRTFIVSATGSAEELPGDWLEKLVALNVAPSVQFLLRTTSAEETERLRSRFEAARIESKAFAHKGYTSPTSLVVTVNRSNIRDVAQLVHELETRLDGVQEMKRDQS
jgi:hypothetical protein